MPGEIMPPPSPIAAIKIISFGSAEGISRPSLRVLAS
jgi:hypothetical protein